MNENILNEKKNEKRVNLYFVLLIILIILFCLVLGLKMFIGSKNTVKFVINNALTKLSNSIIDNSLISGDITLNFNVNSSNSELESINNIINNIDLKINYGIDYDKNLMFYNAKPIYKNSEVLDASLYINKNKGYLFSQDLYDKYISFDLNDYSKKFEIIDKSDFNQIIEGLKKGIEIALKEDYFKKEKVTLNGKKILKTTLIIDDSKNNAILNDFYNSLLANQEFLSSYSKLVDLNVDELKSELERSKTYKLIDNIELSVYTDNLEFVKLELISGDYKTVISKDNNTYNLIILVAENELYNVSVTLIKENDYNKLTISYIDMYYESTYIINATYSIKHNEDVNIPNISNNVSYYDMTNEEYEKIMVNLLSNDKILEIIEEITNLFSNTNLNDMDF